jgi:hypothetical protein
MTILIIGKSSHLCEAISLAYPDHEIKTITWRGLAGETTQACVDLIFVVGFDYGSYMKPYEDYMNVNVTQPILAVQRFAKPTTAIVYVATQNGRKTFTFSRYRYAKEKLGHALAHQLPHAYVLRFDTFATSNHEPLVKGGAATRLIFSCLVKLGVIKTVDMLTVRERLKDHQIHASHDLPAIQGFFMAIPRPQFVDRLMRLFIA